MSRVSEQADAATLEQKTATVQEAIARLRVAGLPSLTGMQVRTLERLYDRAREDGRQSGIAQAGMTLGKTLAAAPAEHRIVSLPGSVHDFTGDPLPGYGQGPITPAESYPIRALCSECHQLVRCETAESPWEHTR